MRFKIDENVHPEVADYLCRQGHDALTVWDEGLQGAMHSKVAEACQHERRTLLTLDLDFADIRTYPPEQYAGIIVLRLGSQSRIYVLQAVARLEMLLSQTENGADGHLWIADEQQVRIRGADESASDSQ
jgi:predicted nuclease of predicted toxin-antitoxin system